jgi:hypothetical protein
MAAPLQLRFQEDSWCRLSFGDAAFPRVVCEQASALSNPRTNAGGNKGADRSVSNGAPHAFDLGTNIHHLRPSSSARFIAPAQSLQCSVNKERSWNKTLSRQVLSLAERSHFVSMREIHAPKSYPIQNRRVVLRTPDRNSNGTTFTPSGRRIGDRCYGFLVPRDCSCPGISVVPVAGKLPLLLL